jgi:PAS domain S-box-containing protein
MGLGSGKKQSQGVILLALFHAFSMKCTQIQRAIRTGDDELVTVLDRELEPLVAAIVAYRAGSVLEIYMQLQFMSNLIRQESEDRTCVLRNSAALSILLDRYFAGASESAVETLLAFASEKPARADAAFDSESLFSDMVLDSMPDRVAVITRDYRYLYSNTANSQHLNRKPMDMIGRHLSEFIGVERFEQRAKPHLDACFSGEAIEYVYESRQAEDGQARNARCRMRPLRAAKGEIIGALLILQEVDATADVLMA